jgi:branched-chain amino acid transport system ATP-binding protein
MSSLTASVIAIDAISKDFGGLRAIDNLSLEVRSGEILGIVGPNGAGKSVLINLITGFYRVSAGAIHFKGRDISGLSRHAISRLGITRTFQNIRLFRRMSVLENVLVANKRHAISPFASLFGMRRRDVDQAMEFISFMGLAERADQLAGTLAYGDARRLEIARALAGEPHLLLLDEPAAGMNEEETAALIDDIRASRARVAAIVLVEHDMTLIRELSDRMVAIDYGRKMAEGSTEEVFADPTFNKAYLGLETEETQIGTLNG